MTDIRAKLGDPHALALAATRLDEGYRGMLNSLRTTQDADVALACKGAPAAERRMTERLLACTTAAMTGNLSAVRKQLGARIAEAMLRQIAADAGLDINRRGKA